MIDDGPQAARSKLLLADSLNIVSLSVFVCLSAIAFYGQM